MYYLIGISSKLEDILVNAENYSKKVLKLDYEKAKTYIKILISFAFKPLKLFPYSNSDSQLMFDADWLTSIISKVHITTGYSPDYIINQMSLSAACYYFAQWARLQGSNNIHRRTDEEILILQMERSVDLICERLIELNVFPKEDRLKYRMIMLTPPDTIKSK